MKEAPTMISTKDLAYLTDIFGWNFTAAKTAHHFSDEVVSDDVKDIMNKLFDMHKDICESILSILEGGQK